MNLAFGQGCLTTYIEMVLTLKWCNFKTGDSRYGETLKPLFDCPMLTFPKNLEHLLQEMDIMPLTRF